MKVTSRPRVPTVPPKRHSRRLIAGAILTAGGVSANLFAAPPPATAPELFPGPIPAKCDATTDPAPPDCEPNTGFLDIDFRLDEGFPGPDKETWTIDGATATLGKFVVTAGGGDITQNVDCPDLSRSLDSFGVGDTVATGDRNCDDGIERKESLTLTFLGGTEETAAGYDVNGLWLTDFSREDSEAGVIELTGIDGDVIAYSFSWKDVNPADVSTDPNPNNEFFVGFGETVRFTKAVISSTSSFSVAGFSQQPIVIYDGGQCGGDGGEDDGKCTAEEARNLFLNIETPKNVPGDRGVNGTIYRRGVYVIDDARPQCQPEFATDPQYVDPVTNTRLPFTDWEDLPIYLSGGAEPDTVLAPWQCGYPEVPGGTPRAYVVEVDGSELVITEDTIESLALDDEDLLPENEWKYFCRAADPWLRPIGGYSPIYKSGVPFEEQEISVLDENGNIVKTMQNTTIGPCGSGRLAFGGRSYLHYHVVIPAGADYDAIIQARIDNRLGPLVKQLYPCLQEAVSASVTDNVNSISNNFQQGKYVLSVEALKQLRQNLLTSPLNDEIGAGQCFFDLLDQVYLPDGPYPPPNKDNIVIPGGDPRFREANAVGTLLVEIDHLIWTINTTVRSIPPESFDNP